MVDVKSRATDMWALFEAIDQCEPDVEKQVLTSLQTEYLGEKCLVADHKIVWESDAQERYARYFREHPEELHKLEISGKIQLSDEQVFCDTLGNEKKLVICGGGHVSIPVIRMGRMIGCHVIVLEDLAYFAMDFRQDLSKPYQAPFQPSVAHYTDNYVLLISGSKAFSYAGQRIGVSCISDKLYHRSYPGLTKRYGGGTFGTVFIHRVLYALSSGTSHSAQFAMAAMLKAANEGQYNFLNEVKIYGERAQKLKEIFLRHGFHLVYDNDLGDPIADGFYFTIGYPGMTSGELAKELMYYGVSAISLVTTGSHQEGLRACTSFIKDHQYAQLDERMKLFAENHPVV